MDIPLSGARAMLLAAQGLLEPPAHPAAKEDVLAAIRNMGGLQIDTISVIARSPYLVLWSRLGAYEPRWLDELLAEGALFEYWSRAACFIPIEDYSLYRGRMLAHAARSLGSGEGEQAEMVRSVLARIRESGAARSAHFKQEEKRKGVWWNRKPEKIALETLFNSGVLMIARREGMQRVYDLHERVLPGWDDAAVPDDEESRRTLALKAVRALGVARPRWVSRYFPDSLRTVNSQMCRFGLGASPGASGNQRPAARSIDRILKELVDDGQAFPVSVEGITGPAYVHRDHAALAEKAADGALESTVTTLLSPFDPVVHDRNLARELFEFDYLIETYTPAARRKYGYFTLPILHRGALVGRLDPKAHRKEGIFEVKALYLEPGIPVTGDLVQSLGVTLEQCALWHGTPEVVIRRSDPPELAEKVQAEVRTAAPNS